MEEGKAKPRIALFANDRFVELSCVMCGESFQAGEILPKFHDEDGQLIGYLCDACAYERQNYASKLRAQAKRLENAGAWFRQLADIGIQPPDADHRLKLESLILVGDSQEIDKLNSAEKEKGKPGNSLKGKKFVALTWDKQGKKLVLLFEGDRILWIAPARKREDEELVVDTDAQLILGEGRGDELIDHPERYFKLGPGSTWHKWG